MPTSPPDRPSDWPLSSEAGNQPASGRTAAPRVGDRRDHRATRSPRAARPAGLDALPGQPIALMDTDGKPWNWPTQGPERRFLFYLGAHWVW